MINWILQKNLTKPEILEGDAYKLIECNCFNGTGFYKHDIEKIIIAINAFIRKAIKTKIK